MLLEQLKHYFYILLAEEISRTSRYFDRVFQLKPNQFDNGLLLSEVDCPSKQTVSDISSMPPSKDKAARMAVLLNGNLNYDLNIVETLGALRERMNRNDRLFAIVYNSYFRWLYAAFNMLRIRQGALPSTFVTRTSLNNLARLSGYEVLSITGMGFFPFRLFGIGTVLNKILSAIPFVRWLGVYSLVKLRPCLSESGLPSLTIVIPARNEKGNIEAALRRIPSLGGARIEVIFVEGHSNDGTWQEIERCIAEISWPFPVKAFQQTGKGKGDAVRLGFSHASCDLLTILDADLSTPPELLASFYEAYCRGLGDFINGNRLVYPIEGRAMRFLNRLGNIFFAKALSHTLEVPLGDSLCGTKLFARHDYARFKLWREDFGDFDPFGDFEILFPAAILGLGIVDVPIHYRDRTYGATNIHRFRHGLMLLRMVLVGLFRIRLRLGAEILRKA